MLYAEASFAHWQDIYDWSDLGLLPGGVRVKGAVSLSDIQAALEDGDSGLPTIGIPVTYSRDQIQFGKMISKQVEDCLVVKNGQHPSDYFHFVFTVRSTGNMSTVTFYRSGSSAQIGKQNLKAERKGSGTLFGSIAGALTKTDDRALNEEMDYYAMAADVIKEQFGC